jgi:hypothetical protein
MDPAQNLFASGIDECHVPDVEAEFLGFPASFQTMPGSIQFIHPWSGDSSFKFHLRSARFFMDGDSEHFL